MTDESPRLTRSELAQRSGDPRVMGSVRLVELADGPARGVRVLEFRTGSGLTFEVLVDRAMDLGAAEFEGHAFGWRSSTDIRHPAFHTDSDEDGYAWLRSFNGLLLTGGLDHTLIPERSAAEHYGYPLRPTRFNGLHGRIANTPARLLGYGEEWMSDDRCVLWCEGEVAQAAVFGENLRLRRRIECDLGGSTIRLTDSVMNAGYERTPHMQLYHINFGWPFIDEGTRILLPVTDTRWQTDAVAEQGYPRDRATAPQHDFKEQTYEHVLATRDGRGRAVLSNERLDLGIRLSWDARAMPCALQWLNMKAGIYGVAIEPSTHHVEGFAAAVEDGTMTWLEHGDVRRYDLVIEVITGRDAIATAAASVEELTAG